MKTSEEFPIKNVTFNIYMHAFVNQNPISFVRKKKKTKPNFYFMEIENHLVKSFNNTLVS